MRAILVDDEKNVRNALVKLIGTFCPEVEIVGEADSIQSAEQLIKTADFDLAFLDIELHDGSGIDLLQNLGDREFHVIFVTAYNQFALDAFRLSAADYLLKPVNPEHLIQAVKRVSRMNGHPSRETELEIIREQMQMRTHQESKIILRDSENIFVVKIREIVRCEANGGYTHFVLADGRTILTSIHLMEYEKILCKCGFIRAHRSHLVNTQHIISFSKQDGGTLFLTQNNSVPVSSRKRDALLKALEEIAIN
jgi:two-component system LytT family response regulator